jgi:hypothetical protein
VQIAAKLSFQLGSLLGRLRQGINGLSERQWQRYQFQLRQNYGSRHNKKSRFASNFSKLSTKLAWTRHPKGDAQEECELAFTPHRFLFNFNNLPRAKWI